MVINVVGVAGSMGVEDWSRLARYMTSVSDGFGMTVTLDGGTARGFTVSAGERYQAGTLFTSTSAVSGSVPANTSGSPRMVVICAQVSWSGTTQIDAGSVVVVQGTPGGNPVAPQVTKQAGVLWQTPLAVGRVNAGATAITELQQVPPTLKYNTARHSGTASRSVDQSAPNNVWTELQFLDSHRQISDYGVQPISGPNLMCPVAGTYAVAGHASLQANATGVRYGQIARYTSNGTLIWAHRCEQKNPTAGDDTEISFSGIMDAGAGDYLRLEIFQNSGGTLLLKAYNVNAGGLSWGSIRLIQAD